MYLCEKNSLPNVHAVLTYVILFGAFIISHHSQCGHRGESQNNPISKRKGHSASDLITRSYDRRNHLDDRGRKNQQAAANQLAFSLSEGEQTVLPNSIQSSGTPFTYDPQRQQLMEETASSSFSQMTLTFQTKSLQTLTIKSAFLQTDEKNGQVKEDIINTTDVAVVLPENESTEATSTEAVLSDTQDQTEASEKRL